jgi:transposase
MEPPAPIQELRDLTRIRKQLVREISQHSSRIQKILEDANLKLGSVLSNGLGKSGRAILHALIAGETNPEKLADLAEDIARNKRTELIEALHGRIREHHRRLLKVHLELVAALEQALADIDATVGKTLAPIQSSARLLTTLPGVSDLTAQVMVAEIGVDMSRFPTAAHLISWTGLCPRSDESAGKRRSSRVRKGAPWLKTALRLGCGTRQRLLSASPVPSLAFTRRGAKKAILAVAASMLTAAYHMLKTAYHTAISSPITSPAVTAPKPSCGSCADSTISAARSR